MRTPRAAIRPIGALVALLLVAGLTYAAATVDPPAARAGQHQVRIVLGSCDVATGLTEISVWFPSGPYEAAIEDADDFVRRVFTPGARLSLPPGAYEWVFIEVIDERKHERGRGSFTIEACDAVSSTTTTTTPTTAPTTPTTTTPTTTTPTTTPTTPTTATPNQPAPPTPPPPATGAIGDFVWFDADGDGVQDPDEAPVSGVRVELYTSTDRLLGTLVTGPDGRYRFENLIDGDYRVRFTHDGAAFSPADAADELIDSDAVSVAPGVAQTPLIPIRNGALDLSWDAGLVCPAVRPWDGISNQVVTEGVTRRVDLVAPFSREPLRVTVEDDPRFASLADHGDGTATLTLNPRPGDAGTYAGVALVASNGCTSFADIFTITVLPGSASRTGPGGGTVAGRVFVDEDGDGTYDTGEQLISGLSVVVVGEGAATTIDGRYAVDVAAGEHLVRLDTQALRDRFRAVQSSRAVSVGAGSTVPVDFPLSAGLYDLRLTPNVSQLGAGETIDVTVEVLGGAIGTEVLVELDGGSILQVSPSEIEVAIGTPRVVSVTGIDPGAGTLTGTIPGGSGSVPLKVLPGGTITGAVYIDHNGNGTRDVNEPLVPDDRRLTIRMVRDEGPEVRAGAGFFGGRVLGSARLALQTPGREESIPVRGGEFELRLSRPGTYELSVENVPNAIPGRVVLVVATVSRGFRVEFGVPGEGAGISGTVFVDGNRNCTLDENEEAIVGVGVRIQGEGRDEVTVTGEAEGDGGENYGFVADAGSYLVSIDPTVLGPITVADCADRSIQVVLDEGTSHAGADFPIVSAPLSSITGTVWCDLDGDNRRHPLEKEIPGVTLVLTGAAGERRTLTQSGGGFEFSELLPGDYTVAIEPSGLDSVAFADNDPRPITLGLGETRFLPLALCQSDQVLFGFVFEDLNGDGSRDDDEPGLAGVAVEIDGPDGFSDSTTTDGDGSFLFPSGEAAGTAGSLPLGDYEVRTGRQIDVQGETLTLTSPESIDVQVGLGSVSDPAMVFGFGVEDTGFPWLILISGLATLLVIHWLPLRGIRRPGLREQPSGREPGAGEPGDRPLEDTPYRGPRPFRWIDLPEFEGREREIRELESLTYPNRILVVYGPSGAGKSSLLNAGYIPGLDTSEFEVLPVARFQLGPQLADASIPNVFSFAVVSYLSDCTEPPALTVAEYLVGRQPLRDDLGLEKARVVVIDEFQEMYRLYRGQADHRQSFFDDIEAALESDPLVRFVLCIDEDEKGELEPYIEQFGPHIVSDYRVEPLDAETALAAITLPPAHDGGAIEPAAASMLVDHARTVWAEHSGHRIEVVSDRVDLLALQVTAAAAWRKAQGGPLGVEHVVDWEDGDAALRSLYDSAVRHLDALVAERRLREWCERALISPDGNRAPLSMGDAGRAGMPPAVIDGLVGAGLLVEVSRGDLSWFELAHDRFVAAIRDSNRLRRERDLIDASAGLLTAAARMWEIHGQGEAGLLAERDLETARAWASAHPGKVGPAERAYLEASIAAARAAAGAPSVPGRS